MASGDDKLDLNDFLQRVDEIESVVKGFNSGDETKQQESLDTANKLLKETGGQEKSKHDRTLINTTSSHGSKLPDNIPEDQAGFLRSLEADAADRARKRKERGKVAMVWKEKGNDQFKAGNYQMAIEHYTEGMNHLKDMVVLYTNRAQAYNRLGDYDNALKDCEAAMFLGPKTVKAYIHQGKAYVGQGKYEEAINSYEEILTFDPKQGKIVNEYISNANQARVAAQAESHAAQVFQSGDVQASSVVQVLDKLNTGDQPVIYYDGGMKILGTMIKDDTSRTLFRTHGGFKLFTDNAAITGCFKRVLIPGCAEDTIDLVCTCLETLQNVIRDNDENNKCMVRIHGFPDALLTVLGNAPTTVQISCIRLMLLISQNAVGRAAMVSQFDNIRLLVGLMTFVQNSKTGSEDAAKILNNLALEKKFVGHFSSRVSEEVLPAFENLMHNCDKVQSGVFPSCLSFMGNMAHDVTIRREMCNRHEFWDASLSVMVHSGAFPSCISFMGNMTHDVTIRREMCNRHEFWDASLSVMTRYSDNVTQPYSHEVLHPLLGLLINVALETSDTLKSLAPEICKKTITLLQCQDDEIKGRATGLLSRVLPHLSEDEMADLCDRHLPKDLIEILQSTTDDTTKRYATKTLTVLTQSKEDARREVFQTDKELRTLCSLLSGSDDVIIANIALCIGYCSQVPGVSSSLVGSGVIRTLLAKTDTTNSTIKQNCAITLAKLASSDPRHLKEVHELGGIGILNSCMKHVK
ncbi:tetratricopeptide repeat protein 12-like [Amphiura filiformis]|uniref:tetratricopeptide repeat protein 12-like n=1 Tax=Amphiura filiformis TaxID=82378 RepID=UPI003B217C3A